MAALRLVACAMVIVSLSACSASSQPAHLSTLTPQTTAQRDEALLEEATRVIKAETAAETRVYAGVDDIDALRVYETPSHFRFLRDDVTKFRANGLITRGQPHPMRFRILGSSTDDAGAMEVQIGYCEDDSDLIVVGRDGHALPPGSQSSRTSLVASLLRGPATHNQFRLDSTTGSKEESFC
ncbi:hypothetical protein [Galbitalea soli]|uniref:Lipoprotein n=1 Tax=Galbitalea soli TaxID=1268042 RepID=A0A7C9PM28_9MICO|nr:hypothetical protein [Galbitalea soli]NEM90566.1 hypothetical protein [Galbitalea soli]NYJ31281.1 hypothetical protein [Galbitalea soli]